MTSEKNVSTILLIGSTGQLGWELKRSLSPFENLVALDRKSMDLCQPDKIREVIRHVSPNLIVNAAAYTAVDKAEEEIELAKAVNSTAPGIIAEEAEKLQVPLIHYSTDYVFSGDNGGTPYMEDDETDPQNVYGQTKLAGEQAIQRIGVPHLIFRTSWVYGARGKNFLLTIQRLARERDTLKIINDQTGAPTWCGSLADATGMILKNSQIKTESYLSYIEKISGIYHMTCAGKTTWLGFANAILKRTHGHRQPKILPIPTSEYPTPASRPKNSLLSNVKLQSRLNIKLPDWEEALNQCLISPETRQ
jgi:dTDP-4-dehydrorhamnose reductase